MTLMSRAEDDAVEFRAGTLNDLLEAAKGGRPQTSADVQRYRSLAIGGGVSSALLAVALIIVLLTGRGGKGNAEAAGTTTTTMAPIPAPPDMPTTFRVSLDVNRVPSGLKPCAHIGFTDGQATVENAFIRAVNRQTNTIAGTTTNSVILDFAVRVEDRDTMTRLLANKAGLQTFGGEAPATLCPGASASG